jgi:hypothetical protein
MKQIKETEKLLLFEEETGTTKKIYRQSKEDAEAKKNLIYTYLKSNIEYEFEGVSIKKIVVENSHEIPSFLGAFGYGFQEKSLNNYFKFNFNSAEIDKIVLSEIKTSSKSGKSLILNYVDIESLLNSINQEQRACNDTKKILIKNLIIQAFPKINFDFQETNNNKELILRNLNDKLIEKLTASEVQQIGDFYVKAARKFKAGHIIKKMTAGLLKNAQILTLHEIILKYEKLLKDNPAESEWQKFFDEYITLFDSRYVHKINYKNIATGLTKFPDLVLVDIYGYIDFYELKKSGTELIQYDKSHKTWYWSKDVSMVIAQASDYLQKAKENALSYSKTIKTETETETEEGLEVNIINPRAIIVIGTTNQLDTEKKKHHFKNLRESLKDIEFVLYDELLERLKNLLDTIKIDK